MHCHLVVVVGRRLSLEADPEAGHRKCHCLHSGRKHHQLAPGLQKCFLQRSGRTSPQQNSGSDHQRCCYLSFAHQTRCHPEADPQRCSRLNSERLQTAAAQRCSQNSGQRVPRSRCRSWVQRRTRRWMTQTGRKLAGLVLPAVWQLVHPRQRRRQSHRSVLQEHWSWKRRRCCHRNHFDRRRCFLPSSVQAPSGRRLALQKDHCLSLKLPRSPQSSAHQKCWHQSPGRQRCCCQMHWNSGHRKCCHYHLMHLVHQRC
mmetsp:Transcript_44309/g.77750  ORF Transcript_44309/g.77750 Transcript_44309/m.77750 type:complete len:257 (+) Transcript_44309:681-1451(+)